jgi:ABC-type transport system involved in Fe-S cluster assembly fused permease/ATPase subunit
LAVTTRTLVDGQSVARRPLLQRLRRATLASLRDAIAYVAQDTLLFAPVEATCCRPTRRLRRSAEAGRRGFIAAQPAPHHIRAMVRQGVRTIINLRGARLQKLPTSGTPAGNTNCARRFALSRDRRGCT